MGVHGGVWRVMKSGSHWVGGAGRQAASGPEQARLGQLWAVEHDGQS